MNGLEKSDLPYSSWEAGERSGANRARSQWREGAGPERMWTCKTRTGCMSRGSRVTCVGPYTRSLNQE